MREKEESESEEYTQLPSLDQERGSWLLQGEIVAANAERYFQLRATTQLIQFSSIGWVVALRWQFPLSCRLMRYGVSLLTQHCQESACPKTFRPRLSRGSSNAGSRENSEDFDATAKPLREHTPKSSRCRTDTKEQNDPQRPGRRLCLRALPLTLFWPGFMFDGPCMIRQYLPAIVLTTLLASAVAAGAQSPLGMQPTWHWQYDHFDQLGLRHPALAMQQMSLPLRRATGRAAHAALRGRGGDALSGGRRLEPFAAHDSAQSPLLAAGLGLAGRSQTLPPDIAGERNFIAAHSRFGVRSYVEISPSPALAPHRCTAAPGRRFCSCACPWIRAKVGADASE
ncbi:MAG: hypothetical protein HUU23_15405 [Caldilineales bacterium]|nr:hypothetical protein [Caldilineales bacterium]